MPVVKKTVAFHPIMDNYVRKLLAILIEKGWNATYSTALNYMILGHAMDVSTRKMHPKVVKILQDFLHDRKTIREIQRHDRLTKYSEESRKQIKERQIA
jgi:hypothetical protein